MGFLDKNPGGFIGADAEYDLGGIFRVKDAVGGMVTNGLQFYLDAANKNTYTPYSVRYIRWSANGSTANASTHFVELQAWGTDGVNKASGIPTTIIQGNYVGGANTIVTNGNTATAEYYDMSGTQPTIQIDLGSVQSIHSFNLWMYYGDGRSYYSVTLQISTDGTNFYTIYGPVTAAINNTRITKGSNDMVSSIFMTPVNLSYSSSNKGYFAFDSSKLYANTSAFNKTSGQEITVCAMIYPQALGGAYRDIFVNRSDSLYNWILYQHTNDGSIQLHGTAQNKSTYIPTINTWVYICATVDSSGNYKLYANGAIVQTMTGYAYGPQAPSYLCIGAFGASSYEPWYGRGSVYQIYNRALTQDEVLRNFNAIRGRYGI